MAVPFRHEGRCISGAVELAHAHLSWWHVHGDLMVQGTQPPPTVTGLTVGGLISSTQKNVLLTTAVKASPHPFNWGILDLCYALCRLQRIPSIEVFC